MGEIYLKVQMCQKNNFQIYQNKKYIYQEIWNELKKKMGIKKNISRKKKNSNIFCFKVFYSLKFLTFKSIIQDTSSTLLFFKKIIEIYKFPLKYLYLLLYNQIKFSRKLLNLTKPYKKQENLQKWLLLLGNCIQQQRFDWIFKSVKNSHKQFKQLLLILEQYNNQNKFGRIIDKIDIDVFDSNKIIKNTQYEPFKYLEKVFNNYKLKLQLIFIPTNQKLERIHSQKMIKNIEHQFLDECEYNPNLNHI